MKSEKTFKSILVTGARQTGKSTVLQKLFPEKKYVLVDDPFIEEQAVEQFRTEKVDEHQHKGGRNEKLNHSCYLVVFVDAGAGIEPAAPDNETGMLPLHHPAGFKEC